ncbi:glycosyl transferase group 1 [Sulfuricaulis limicola]|uniref:Glycosyl transferase group 1 n=1 Tax=Sulfuricaulis limicola TaxID=1620215 RepID=A0A1B4XGJ0_9GAMM|nr:glycosyl transferase group 1 [Sulfuricaulis limicola]
MWFVNTPFPAVNKRLGKKESLGTGWWMKTTMNAMANCEMIGKIGIVWASNEIREFERFEEDNSIYYLVPDHPLPARKKSKLSRVWSRLNGIINMVKPYSYQKELAYCVRAVRDFKPDLIHVWGTENFYGLISDIIDVPVLVKFQGLISVIKDDVWGDVKWRHRFLMPNEALYQIDITKRSKNEIKIIKQNKYFEGRTLWDYSHLREHNISAQYYDVPEIMRPSFYESRWSIDGVNRHSVYMTARSMPAKGVPCLIKAIGIVRKYVPDVQLRIGGHITDKGYGKYIRSMVSDMGLDDCVAFLGPVTENEIINELLNAHVYVLSSYIENSCNSLIEAELVGVPCVASYVGGIPSLINDLKTGLFFQKGDSAALAMAIRRIFDDDALALRLSEEARKFSLERFNGNRVINGILSAYRDILDRENHERSVQ